MTTSYLTPTAADALAADLPDLPAWVAATTDEKSAALVRATLDVDNAMPYQGRKYDPGQARAFPRCPYDDSPGLAGFDGSPREEVWDWDTGASAAVTPEDVELAVLFQAEAILAGERESRISAQHDGIVYDQIGSVAESYKQTQGPGVTTGLCRAAWVLMRKYRLKSGRMR